MHLLRTINLYKHTGAGDQLRWGGWLQVTVYVLQASNTRRGVCIPLSEVLTLDSRAQPSPQQAFCLCVDSLFPPSAELLWTTPLCHADTFMWFLFPVIEWSQVNYIWKGEEKRAPCTASAAESVPPRVACGSHPASLAVVQTKEGFPRFYCKTEKYIPSSSGENVTPLKFPAFLSRLCSVLGRDWGNMRWPWRENSRDLCLNCLNS